MSTEKLRAGDRLGDRFRIERHLADGGGGTVYVASDLVLQNEVALKIVFEPDAITDATTTFQNDGVRRLIREVGLGQRISHPNVVRVHDYFAVRHQDHLLHVAVMELLQGEPLHIFLQRRGGFLAPGEAVSILVALATAVQKLHDENIVHRDLKPRNIFICADRTLKLLDFGISRPLDGSKAITGTRLPGTLPYMSPEQFEFAHPAVSQDVYGFGAVAYELLTGQPPDRGKNEGEIFHNRRRVPPAPSLVQAAIPPALDAAVLRCLDAKPDKRFPSLRDAAHAFEESLAGKGSTTNGNSDAPPHSRRAWGFPLAIGVLAVVATVLLVLVVSRHIRRAERKPAATSISANPSAGVDQVGEPDVEEPHEVVDVDDAAVSRDMPEPQDGSLPEGSISPSESPSPARPEEYMRHEEPPVRDPATVTGPRTDTDAEPLGLYVESGSFVMGSSEQEVQAVYRDHDTACADDELPAHEVTVGPFRIDPRMATFAEIHESVGWNPGETASALDSIALGVPWNVANEHCRKKGKRLPTETELEYLARLGLVPNVLDIATWTSSLYTGYPGSDIGTIDVHVVRGGGGSAEIALARPAARWTPETVEDEAGVGCRCVK